MSILSVIRNSYRESRHCIWPAPHAILVRLLFNIFFFLLVGACALSTRYLTALIRDLLLAQ